jgi:rubrerythrin
MAVGYVYILSNPAIPGLLKIGFTTHAVENRAAELSASTAVVTPFVVEYWHLTAAADDVERRVHEHFKNHRENKKREFFRVDLDHAIDEINRHLQAPPVKYRRLPPPAAKPPPSATKSGLPTCRRCGYNFAKDIANMFCPKCGY